jgi:2-hydroxychromene-2-carboxylate isomerase
MEPILIDFYFGLGSRYSYLASTQIDRIEAQYGCRFVWKPVSSGALPALRGRNPFQGEPVSGQYDWSYREYDAKGWAAYYGVPFREPQPLAVDPARLAHAALAAEAQDALIPCCLAIFAMGYVEHALIDEAALLSLPLRLRLDAKRFRGRMDAVDTLARRDAIAAEAHRRGAFGVPTFFLGERMFWGNDRLVLLEAALRGTELPFLSS